MKRTTRIPLLLIITFIPILPYLLVIFSIFICFPPLLAKLYLIAIEYSVYPKFGAMCIYMVIYSISLFIKSRLEDLMEESEKKYSIEG